MNNIGQYDGNQTISSSDTSDTSDCSDNDQTNDNFETSSVFDTDDEIDKNPIPANFYLDPNQSITQGQPITLDVNISASDEPTSELPLCVMLNARSLYNKSDNFRTLLHEIGVEVAIVSETWERQRQSLEELLSTDHYQIISYCRKKLTNNRQPGGGCAIIYNNDRFVVEPLEIQVPENVEAVWALFTPKTVSSNSRVKKIAVGSVYVSPKSQFKQDTIDHIIETLHIVRSTHDDVRFLFGGDLNRLNISDILEAH